jgi:hypothetical protein
MTTITSKKKKEEKTHLSINRGKLSSQNDDDCFYATATKEAHGSGPRLDSRNLNA